MKIDFPEILTVFFLIVTVTIIVIGFHRNANRANVDKAAHKAAYNCISPTFPDEHGIYLVNVEGHEYIYFSSRRGIAVCHSPDCMYCKGVEK